MRCQTLSRAALLLPTPDFADDIGAMPTLIIIALGAAFSAWSILLILAGERQRRLNQSLNSAFPVKQNNKN
jgi:hypothetical protein